MEYPAPKKRSESQWAKTGSGFGQKKHTEEIAIRRGAVSGGGGVWSSPLSNTTKGGGKTAGELSKKKERAWHKRVCFQGLKA